MCEILENNVVICLFNCRVIFGNLLATFFNLLNVAFIIPSDYSKGFGGKYGVQKDRVDQVLKDFFIYHTQPSLHN